MKRSLILPLFLLAACSHSQSDDQQRPKALQKALTCEEWRATLPSDVATAKIDVPESPGSVNKIQVFYYYRKPLHGKIAVFMNGGPGASSHSSFKLMENALKEFGVSDQMSFVYMDQRGTGCSSAYPQESTDDLNYERGRWYGSRMIVEDAELIRRALSLSKWSVFGQSYGAMIAHRYAVMYAGSLERVVAYANTITPDRRMRQSGRMASQLDVWNAYFNVYPDDRAKMQTLLAQLTSKICVPVLDENYCGTETIEDMVSSFLGFHDDWDRLHSWFEALLVNGSINMEKLQKFANLDAIPYDKGRSLSLRAVNYWDRDIEFTNREACLNARADSGNPSLFDSTLTECSGAIQFQYPTQAYINVDQYFKGKHDPVTLTDLRFALQNQPKNWFLLYSADLDPWVPVRSFAPELQAVGDLLTYRNFTDVGHDGYYTKREVFDDFLR